VIGVLAGWACGCTHPLDEFRKGSADAGTDTFVADSTTDTATDARSDVKADSTVDSAVDDTSIADAEDAADAADAADVPDTGPSDTDPGCTAAAPAGMTCLFGATFDMGAKNEVVCGVGGCASEQPQVSVKVSQFFIDDHEVSVKAFRTWWNLTSRPWPTNAISYFKAGTKDLKWRGTWPTAPTEPATGLGCFWRGAADATNDDKPLNCVDWYTALGFCLADGRRLATEAEWELAATGGEDRLYPWSAPMTEGLGSTAKDLDCFHTLHSSTCTPANAAYDSTIWGRSRYGQWNMAGSLSEWVLDGHTANLSGVAAGSLDPLNDPAGTTNRITRGGSSSSSSDIRAAARPGAVAPSLQDTQIGFRCVKR